MANPFLAGQRLAAGQLNDATEKTLVSLEVGVAGALHAGITAETTITKMTPGPVSLVAGGLYSVGIKLLYAQTVGTNEFNLIIRRDTALTGPVVTDWVIPPPNATGTVLFSGWDDIISSIADPNVQYYVSLARLSGAGSATVYGQSSTTNRSGWKVVRTGYSSEYVVTT